MPAHPAKWRSADKLRLGHPSGAKLVLPKPRPDASPSLLPQLNHASPSVPLYSPAEGSVNTRLDLKAFLSVSTTRMARALKPVLLGCLTGGVSRGVRLATICMLTEFCQTALCHPRPKTRISAPKWYQSIGLGSRARRRILR